MKLDVAGFTSRILEPGAKLSSVDLFDMQRRLWTILMYILSSAGWYVMGSLWSMLCYHPYNLCYGIVCVLSGNMNFDNLAPRTMFASLLLCRWGIFSENGMFKVCYVVTLPLEIEPQLNLELKVTFMFLGILFSWCSPISMSAPASNCCRQRKITVFVFPDTLALLSSIHLCFLYTNIADRKSVV